jgi:hypothetical protein
MDFIVNLFKFTFVATILEMGCSSLGYVIKTYKRLTTENYIKNRIIPYEDFKS